MILSVVQPIAEGVKRLLCHVAVGAALHVVVGEVGQLGGTFIESDGQSSEAVVFARQGLRYGRAHGFPAVPAGQYSIAVLSRFVECYGTATAQQKNDRLVLALQFVEFFYLVVGQFYASAVAFVKAWHIDWQLLPFQLGAEASGIDNNVSIARIVHQCK